MIRVYIHSGYLSVDNGAVAPVKVMFDLARAVGVPVNTGAAYGEDNIEVDDGDWPVIEQMLIEQKLLYKVGGVSGPWSGVVSSEVKERLRSV